MILTNSVSVAVPGPDLHAGTRGADDSARIVIVDDDPGLRELLTGFLVDHGLRAEAVASGAALRAREIQDASEGRSYGFLGWRVDFAAHELFDADNTLIDLTDGEFAVLRAFVERPRRVLARDALLEAARGPDTDAFDRAIDVQVSRLRRKLRSRGDDIIRTIRNEGYFFVPRVVRL